MKSAGRVFDTAMTFPGAALPAGKGEIEVGAASDYSGVSAATSVGPCLTASFGSGTSAGTDRR